MLAKPNDSLDTTRVFLPHTPFGLAQFERSSSISSKELCQNQLHLYAAVKKRFFFLSALMLLAMTKSVAMSLGPNRSITLIGRPLDMSVQAVLDAQENLGSLCLEADVFYGDNQLSKSRVRVTAEKLSPASQDAVVRVRSSSVVNEPVVMIYLRVGCQQKTERRYVLLADIAPEVPADANAVSPLAPPLQLSPPLVMLPPASLPTVNPSVNRRTSAGKNPADSAGTRATAEAIFADNLGVPKRTVKKRDHQAAGLGATQLSAANRARLKLEPLDLTIERDPQLKLSLELLSLPASSPEERSAAAALWRAISAQPLDILRDIERLQSLENSVRSLQEKNQKTQQSVNDLVVKLQQVESARYANALVYALTFFLLVALGGLAYLLRKKLFRRRFANRATPWWRQGESQQSVHQSWLDSEVHGTFIDSDETTAGRKTNSELSLKADLAELGRKFDAARADMNYPKKFGRSGEFELPETPGSSPDSQPKTLVCASIQPLSATSDQDNSAQQVDLTKPMPASAATPVSQFQEIDLDFTELPDTQNALPFDLPDPKTFDALHKDVNAGPPAPNRELQTETKQQENAGNLIEFDTLNADFNASERLKRLERS